ncbi:MAG: O-antigen ligase family protein [Candidatus Altimarinota bacterium]
MKIPFKTFNNGVFLTLSKWALKLFLVTFPFQLQWLIYRNGFFNGGFNPFSSVFFGLADILILLSGLFWGMALMFDRGKSVLVIWKERNWLKGKSLTLFFWLFLIIFALVTVIFSPDRTLSLLLTLRLTEIFILYLLLSNRILNFEEIFKYLLIGGVIQALLAVSQYIMQGSLGLSWLGESQLGKEVLNTAKIEMGENTVIRPYGTFAHANLLGGYLFFLMGFVLIKLKEKLWLYLPLLVLILLALILSFSRSAWLGVAAALVGLISLTSLKVNWKYFGVCLASLFVLLLIVDGRGVWLERVGSLGGESLSERVELYELAFRMLMEQWWGSGLGSFVLRIPNMITENWGSWLYQPVHNVFILIAVELGIAGLISLIGLWIVNFADLLGKFKLKDKQKKWQAQLWFAWGLGLVVISLFDHYLLTLMPGLTVLAIYLAVNKNLLEEQVI